MATKVISDKVIIITLSVVVLVLLLVVSGLNSRAQVLIQSNKTLNLKVEAVSNEITALSQKLQAATSELEKTKVLLDETTNSLTQERTNSAKLQEELTTLSALVGTKTTTPAGKEESAAQPLN
jgi:outer membrane murein-binding lipoprotein Lpp